MTASDDRRRRTVGAILAGGVGVRAGLGAPKQLARVAGRSILAHSVALFEGAPEIDEIIVLMAPGHVAEAEEIVAREGFGKVRAVIEGGASRTETTWRALEHIGRGDGDVLLHDAVRFLAEPEIITRCARALAVHGAVGVAVPTSDTLLRVDFTPDGEVIHDIPDRSHYRRAQTPQGFRLEVIREAYRRAFADPGFAERPATDDCGVVLRYLPEVPIFVVPGSERNIKVTHPTDLAIAETLFHLAAPAPPSGVREGVAGLRLAILGEGPVAAALAALAARRGARLVTADTVRTGPDAGEGSADAGWGGLDYAVIVAGGGEGLAEAVAEGVLAPARAAGEVLPPLRESRGGLLFCTATTGRPAAPSPAVAALAGLTRALAAEQAEHGVRVNCLAADATDPAKAAEACLDALTSPVSGRTPAGWSL
ncbi:bifunctional cytidylyltransferase/SDR family oxidoreductase [Spongiactinospora sp. TRM90649]|uniref:bifunctional cytidylyltransferase/SDR family oxidoreductase n=1 Tax=Spongiactinospora sp. TRM90649 TaxID=3031114 RepID=UPI0023F89A6B|nr:bifunctional cytidylyltransferase/SDR family oxidoreductase [Spongiactinospora sp. TRM90649]MDF5751198.1 bifunctional cytidylyltransferase/SDR family oxidoreductase [Spongiactinospora sp. TRM90649]